MYIYIYIYYIHIYKYMYIHIYIHILGPRVGPGLGGTRAGWDPGRVGPGQVGPGNLAAEIMSRKLIYSILRLYIFARSG